MNSVYHLFPSSLLDPCTGTTQKETRKQKDRDIPFISPLIQLMLRSTSVLSQSGHEEDLEAVADHLLSSGLATEGGTTTLFFRLFRDFIRVSSLEAP